MALSRATAPAPATIQAVKRSGVAAVFQGLEISNPDPIFAAAGAHPGPANHIAYFLEDIFMRAFDFTPLYRSAIGFDRFAQMFDDAQRSETQPSYPPYNIERVAEDKYCIQMAVAGFERAELDVEIERDTLKIVGRKNKGEPKRTYLHRGIAARDFEHRFQLADHLKVVSAGLDNGLLNIELVREIPETMKPRKIAIDGSGNVQLLDRKAA